MVSNVVLRVAAACGLAFAITGCGGAETGGASGTPAQWVSSATPDAPKVPATSAPAGLKEISSACKLLPADVVVDVLGGSASTKLTAKEDPVEHLEQGKIRFGCTYGQGGERPFGLIVSSRPNQAADAAAAVEAIAQASGVKTTAIKGVGAGGVGYVTDGTRLVAVVATYEDELRVVIFTAPKVVPHAKLVEVAKHVVVQI